MERIGRIAGLFRYPVKSMAGEPLPAASIGWHGVEGDRRLAFARRGARGGFPWLTASKMASLVTYTPLRSADAPPDALPDRVRTPDGRELDLHGEAFRDELSNAHGTPVELIEFKNGIFDDFPISLITTATIAAISAGAELPAETARFRPNVLVEWDGAAFAEDAWVGRTIRFGDDDSGPAIAICMRDLRCSMINIDPATAAIDARLLKSTGRLNEANAGVYATVTKTGTVRVGDAVYRLDA